MIAPHKTAFVFPGQGSQTVGMGKALAERYPIARQTFEEADEILGFALSKIAWEGPTETLNETCYTQPALVVHSIAALRVFRQEFPEFTPAFMAGHSLGELSALIAAASIPFADGVRLAKLRGEVMAEAGRQSPGGMAAILGLDIPAVEKICAEASIGDEKVVVANDNCPGQVVISGAKAAVERAVALAMGAGARRVVPLAVSVAAHSHLMKPAQARFNQALSEAPIAPPQVTVVGNISAAPLQTADDVRADLSAQLTGRVRWTESVQFMLARGVENFVEMGTGNVLSGLIKRINRKTKRFTFGEPDDVEAFRQS